AGARLPKFLALPPPRAGQSRGLRCASGLLLVAVAAGLLGCCSVIDATPAWRQKMCARAGRHDSPGIQVQLGVHMGACTGTDSNT
ncbi:hypothetical protein HaLaN_17598, partial [Haematococcus lacustris]